MAKKSSIEIYRGVATFHASNASAWRKWLEKNHAQENSIWLIIFHKESTTPSVTYSDAVDEAICFGWIDSKINKRDGESFYQYFARRNPKSNWSKVNKEKVARLQKAGKLEPPGLAAIQLAKTTGTWTALDAIENGQLPDDLVKALKVIPSAEKNFTAFPRSVKRGILEWIQNAKRPETRSKRIAETAALAGKNQRANQYQKKE